MFEQGSTWRKWDLHIHSPLSILNNQYPKLSDGTPDWEAFISKLESLDIAVLGITDYFTIDGYKKIKEFKSQGRLANIHTILPNVEFRLNSVISSKKDGQEPRRLNFHVIFSDEVSEQDIEEHFLHDLSFFYEGNPQDKDDTRKLKRSNIEELGKKLIEQHKNFKDSGLSPLEVGAMQTVVSHEEITELLGAPRFKGKYIIVFGEIGERRVPGAGGRGPYETTSRRRPSSPGPRHPAPGTRYPQNSTTSTSSPASTSSVSSGIMM